MKTLQKEAEGFQKDDICSIKTLLKKYSGKLHRNHTLVVELKQFLVSGMSDDKLVLAVTALLQGWGGYPATCWRSWARRTCGSRLELSTKVIQEYRECPYWSLLLVESA